LYQYRHGIRLWAAHQLNTLWPGFFPDEAAEARDNLRSSSQLARGDGYAPQDRFQRENYCLSKANKVPALPFHFLDGYRLGHHVACLLRIRAWAEQQGAELVLLDMPVTADLEAEHAAAFAVYRQLLRELEHKHGLRVLRGDRVAVGLDDYYFADQAHLNAAGSNSLSCWLRGALTLAGGGG
jgi:hypothetical protein